MWIVRLTEQRATYGPFHDRASATRFRALLNKPAEIEQLDDPITELLNRLGRAQEHEQPDRPSWRGGPHIGPDAEAAYREEQNRD